MTYGWAILIIAIVLAALFDVGVFNYSQSGIKAPPGSCSVQRIDGSASLEGLCQGLEPQFVMHLVQNSGESETYTSEGGSNPGLLVNLNDAPKIIYCVGCANTLGSMTISFWYMNTTAVNNVFLIYADPSISLVGSFNPYGAIVTQIGSFPPPYGQTLYDYFSFVSIGNLGASYNPATFSNDGFTYYNSNPQKFIFYTLTFTPNTLSSPVQYILNVSVFSQGGTSSNTISDISSGYGQQLDFLSTNATLDIGQYMPNGYLSNLQVYNTTLSKKQLTYLYDEGIGGAPANINNLIAWYPLNGNTNDYSGNNNQPGVIGDASFTSIYDSYYQKP